MSDNLDIYLDHEDDPDFIRHQQQLEDEAVYYSSQSSADQNDQQDVNDLDSQSDRVDESSDNLVNPNYETIPPIVVNNNYIDLFSDLRDQTFDQQLVPVHLYYQEDNLNQHQPDTDSIEVELNLWELTAVSYSIITVLQYVKPKSDIFKAAISLLSVFGIKLNDPTIPDKHGIPKGYRLKKCKADWLDSNGDIIEVELRETYYAPSKIEYELPDYPIKEYDIDEDDIEIRLLLAKTGMPSYDHFCHYLDLRLLEVNKITKRFFISMLQKSAIGVGFYKMASFWHHTIEHSSFSYGDVSPDVVKGMYSFADKIGLDIVNRYNWENYEEYVQYFFYSGNPPDEWGLKWYTDQELEEMEQISNLIKAKSEEIPVPSIDIINNKIDYDFKNMFGDINND